MPNLFLRRLVWRALDNALDSGFRDFLCMKAEEIVQDVAQHHVDLEGYLPATLVPHIVAWQEKYIRPPP